MPIVTMKELLEAGVHYGHHASRWNPKMAPHIYKKQHAIHVVDLRQTVRGLVRSHRFLSSIAEQGGEVILVGTKKQAKGPVEEQARRAGVHWVSERWLGGTLTNFTVVMGRVRRLAELEHLDETGEIESRGKKYAAVLRRELAKLRKNLTGIREMRRVPDALILIDPRRERSAFREARALNIPVIAFMDTDSDPDLIDIVIPGNDDAMRSVQLICSKLADAILEGKARAPQPAEAEESAPAAEAFGLELEPAAPAAPSEEAPVGPALEPASAATPAPLEPKPEPAPEPTPREPKPEAQA